MKISATFNGSNADGFVRLWGYHFATGEPVEVSDPHAIQKISGNGEFTSTPADPLDHDGDGAKGGSKAGADSTASKGKRRKRSARPTNKE